MIKYWQLASGDKTRDYADVFLNFGVASLGPGKAGPISEATIPAYKEMGEWEKIKWIVELEEGDRIVLKNGQRKVQAVGEVVKYKGSVYNFSNCFNDIDGWDLQHYVKVKWKAIELIYPDIVLTRKTMQRLKHDEVISDIESRWESTDFLTDKFMIHEPLEGDVLNYSTIEQFLINAGMRIQDAENTSRTINRIEKLANWYRDRNKESKLQATEHEIRTFLVVPFLDVLGWSPQKIAIEQSFERKKIDILLYKDSFRSQPNLLIETKGMWTGSDEAITQAEAYIKNIQTLSAITQFIVTDGLRYWFYTCEKGHSKPIAYMNFNNKRRRYSAYPEIGGMLEFLQLLSPIL